MGTVERPEGPNGEVPKPLRPFVSSWILKPLSFQTSWKLFVVGHKKAPAWAGAFWACRAGTS